VTEESNPGAQQPEQATESTGAESFGRSLGRLARSARAAARAAQPEAERLARQALEAGEAAVPHVKRASRAAAERAGQFVRDNNDDIQRAAATGASLAAGRSGPILRPVILAVADEVNRKVAGLAGTSPADAPATPPAEPQPDSASKGESARKVDLF